MDFLTSAQAREMLPDYFYHDIFILARRNGYVQDEIAEKTLWLGHLCMKGDIAAVKEYLTIINIDEKPKILNRQLHEFFDGTVLHQTLYWNSGNTAIDLFQLLVEHGAEPCLDGYEQYPWTTDGSLWIPLFETAIGERDSEEFQESNDFLREVYEGAQQPTFEDESTPVAPSRQSAQNAPFAARRLVFSDEDEIQDDISASFVKIRLVYSDEDEYADMPALIESDEDEYADMPGLVDCDSELE